MLPTFAQLAGTSLEKEYEYDGVSFVEVLKNPLSPSPRKWILSMGSHPGVGTLNGIENTHLYRDRVVRDKYSKVFINSIGEIEKLESIQKTEDGIDWRKCEKVESFESDPQQVFRINRENILVVKVDDSFHAINEKCPHMNLTMKGGKIDQKTGTILCAWHNTTFCYKTGEVKEWIKVSKPAKFLMKTLMKSNKQADGSLDMEPMDIKSYPTQVIDGYVWVGAK